MKLSIKLILTFLLISIFSTGIVVVSSRVLTNREFDRFISDRYVAELAEELGRYYEENLGWEGIEEEFKRYGREPGWHNEPRQLNFSIADTNGKIVVAGEGKSPGETCNQEEFANGYPILADQKTVGILLLPKAPERSPLDYEFLRRLNASIFFSAFATTLFALFLAIILSINISRPIRELTKATHAMAEGGLGQQVRVRSRDEIGELARSFNKMSSDLARSFNLRKQMTADIAHELRTPIALILGHAEGVKDGVLQPTRENFEIIREEAARLEHLVNDLRTLSLADAGELTINLQVIEPYRLIQEVASLYQFETQKKNISLELDIASPLPTVEVDPTRITQVLTNILDNALRHTPEGGSIVLSANQAGDHVELAIQDSGPGLPREDLERIFERLYRADSSRQREDGGSGLGLAIAKSIVQAHGGQLSAESDAGQGLRVIVALPKSDQRR